MVLQAGAGASSASAGLRHTFRSLACALLERLRSGLQLALPGSGSPRCLAPVIRAPVDNSLRFEGAFKASRGQPGDDFRPLQFRTCHSVGKDPFH